MEILADPKAMKAIRDAEVGTGKGYSVEDLADERGDILALRDKLAGFHRLRIGRFRLIFRYAPNRTIQCLYLHKRSLVYELFESEMAYILGRE